MDSLSNSERFLFAAMKPASWGYQAQETYINIGLIGAILTDLALANAIIIQEEVIVPNRTYRPKGRTVQDEVFTMINKSGKKRKVKAWIRRISQRPGKIRRKAMGMLQNQNLVRIEDKKFLFIPYFRAYVTNPRAQKELLQELREVVLNKETDSDLGPVLTLMDTCRMYKLLARDKSERKRAKKLLQNYSRESVIASGVNQVIKEMQAAVMVATTSAVTASTAGR